MGHGASTRTNVKNISIQNGVVVSKAVPVTAVTAESCKTPRSSSDGCIVETLNSSKCKADLLEIQVDEYKELLRLKECKQVETHEKAILLEAQLAEVEGKNFELTDRVSDLEQQLEALQTNDGQSNQGGEYDEIAHLDQQLESKEQTIMKLEEQVKALEADIKKMRSKFKKRLKAAQMETAEVRQESALKVYSLKDEIKKLEEESTKLIARLDRASSATRSRQGSAGIPNVKVQQEEDDKLEQWEDGRTKLIVELSNQVSAQEETISDLQKQLDETEAALKELKTPSGRTSRPASGKSRNSSAKSGRTQNQKSYWGYSGDDPSMTDQPVNDLKWSPKSPDDDDDVLDRLSSRDYGRKSSAGSQRGVIDDQEMNDISSSKPNQRLSLRGGSGSKKSSRNSSAVSYDSVISENNGDPRSRTSSADVKSKKSSTGSSRQRRRLQAAVADSSRYSPQRTDSAFSDSSAISRTKNGKDSGIDIHAASCHSDFPLDESDDVDTLMNEIVGLPSYDSNI
ncbi:uncharacterized protein [Amphiura filiformis]|uniref:uncharacterized protein n=1 Tax=Amphiura filiformis TaxID=82378 RepID=UPI003B21D369